MVWTSFVLRVNKDVTLGDPTPVLTQIQNGTLTVEQVAACGVVPVVVLEDAEQAVPTAKALLKGGINAMEITFRTSAAKASIEKVAKEVPGMIVGAGTVVNVQQVHDAVEAGAKFLVSPGSDAEVIAEAIKLGVPITPGVVTPSEIMIGLKLGLKVFKFFPAENYGGLKTIKALSGPFPQIKILPTGGINQSNVARRSWPWAAAGCAPRT